MSAFSFEIENDSYTSSVSLRLNITLQKHSTFYKHSLYLSGWVSPAHEFFHSVESSFLD